MITDDHPIFFLQQLFDRESTVASFSRYVYTPDSLFDDRELFQVPGSEIGSGWLETEIGKLRPDQELAIHSNVTINGRTWHIPMLDFSTEQIGPDGLHRIRAFMPRQVFSATAFYSTGRSFHAYSTHLLAPKDWHTFLGRSLLINPKEGHAIVDTRWIGHRLIAGYCSLRFSNNSHQYLAMPRRVGIQSLATTIDRAMHDNEQPMSEHRTGVIADLDLTSTSLETSSVSSQSIRHPSSTPS